jgi:hypothetical protein
VRFAYADPPYLGMCKRYDHNHPDGRCWDEPETHRLLIERLSDEYDGWALSLSSSSLRHLLPMCPEKTRVMAWCKTWASWKPGVTPAFAWEPVLMFGARPERDRSDKWKRRDWWSGVAHQVGFFGSKPQDFVEWIIGCLGVERDDEFVDLFHGSGAVTEAYERWRAQQPLGLTA